MTRSIFKYESSYEYGKNDSDRRVNYIQIVDFCEVEVLLKQMLQKKKLDEQKQMLDEQK